MRYRTILHTVGLLLMCISTPSAFGALLLPSDFTMTINNGIAQTTITGNDLNLTGPDSSDLFATSGNQQTAMWMYNWNLTLDPDPVIAGSFSLTNLTANDVDVSVLFHLPVNSPFAPGLQSGSFDGSFKDENLSGSASLQNVTWNGLIDGNPTYDIVAFGASCSSNPAGCTGSMFSSDPDPELYGPGVSHSIGTEIAFTLSVGDTATFNSTFEVTPVPAPAAAILFGTGLLALMGLRKGQASLSERGQPST